MNQLFKIINNSSVNNVGQKTQGVMPATIAAESFVMTPERLQQIIDGNNEMDAKMRNLLNQRKGLLSYLRPSELDKLIENCKVKALQQSVDSYLAINDVLHTCALRQAQSYCTTAAKLVEASLTGSLIAAQAEMFNTLTLHIGDIARTTQNSLKNDFVNLKEYEVWPALRQKAEERLVHTLDLASVFYEDLLKDFRKALGAPNIVANANNN